MCGSAVFRAGANHIDTSEEFELNLNIKRSISSYQIVFISCTWDHAHLFWISLLQQTVIYRLSFSAVNYGMQITLNTK